MQVDTWHSTMSLHGPINSQHGHVCTEQTLAESLSLNEYVRVLTYGHNVCSY